MLIVTRNVQHERGRSRERSPLMSQRSSTSYGTSGPVPPQCVEAPSDSKSGYQSTRLHQPQRDPLPPPWTTITKKHFIFFLIIPVLVAMFIGLASRIEELNKAATRINREADCPENERHSLEREREVLKDEWQLLKQERGALKGERQLFKQERETVKGERQSLKQERGVLKDERQLFEQERETLKGERQSLKQERGALKGERQLFGQDREAFKGERQLLRKERSALKEERERWEKAREDYFPRGAFWGGISPALDCRAYGKREYWGALENIPEDWTDMNACMNMPVEIKGVAIRRPDRCSYAEGSPHIHGYWMVHWNQSDCKPWHQDFHDTVRSRATIGTP